MGAGSGVVMLFVFLLFFALGVVMSRWIFRVNDIIERLDKIIELLKK